MPIATGTKLGRYEIRSKIGEGGMGEVYLAQDTKLDRKVALKILPAGLAANKERMRRLVQKRNPRLSPYWFLCFPCSLALSTVLSTVALGRWTGARVPVSQVD